MVSISPKALVQVLVFVVLLGLLWFYNHKAENLALMLAQVQQENALLRESEASLKASWAKEQELVIREEEKRKNVDQSLEKVDTSWGALSVHESVLSVLKSAGILGTATPPPKTGQPTTPGGKWAGNQ